MNAYFDAMRRYFDFKGRSTRSQFWLFTLFLLIIGFVAMVIDGSIGSAADTSPGPVFLTVYFLHLVPSLSVSVRRLHDTDRTGWWVLLGLIPIIGQVVLLVWLCSASTAGVNRFGGLPAQSGATPAVGLATGPQSTAPGADLDRLEKLAALKASGAIDDTEFQRLKSDVITRGSGA